MKQQNKKPQVLQAEKEAELRFYTHLFNTTSIGYCTIDRTDGTIIRANQSAERLLGVSLKEMSEQRFVLMVSEEYRAAFGTAVAKAFTGTNTHAVCNVQVPRAQQAPVWACIEVTRSENEHLYHIAITDISERKALKKALHQHELKMYTTLQALPNGILILDTTGTVQMCNSAAEKMLGLTASQIIEKHMPAQGWRVMYENGTPIEEAPNFLSASPHRALSPLAAVIKVGVEQQNITIGLYHLTNEVRWIAVHARPIFPESEASMSGTVISLTDVTEQKRLKHPNPEGVVQGHNAEVFSPPPTTSLPASPTIAPHPVASREANDLHGDFITIATATQGNILLDAKKDIIYLEGADDYTRFTTTTGKEYTTFGSVGKWEQRLFAQGFLRVHRSTIVNFHAIHSWHFEGNVILLNMRDGKQIRVSKGYKAYFLSYVR
jgi:PAS domain S-box-containing protein